MNIKRRFIFPFLVLGISVILSSCQAFGFNPKSAADPAPSQKLSQEPGSTLADEDAVLLMYQLSEE